MRIYKYYTKISLQNKKNILSNYLHNIPSPDAMPSMSDTDIKKSPGQMPRASIY